MIYTRTPGTALDSGHVVLNAKDAETAVLTLAATRMLADEGDVELASNLGPPCRGSRKALTSLALVPRACWTNPSTLASMSLQPVLLSGDSL